MKKRHKGVSTAPSDNQHRTEQKHRKLNFAQRQTQEDADGNEEEKIFERMFHNFSR